MSKLPANPNTALPDWLDMQQALAWVRYRDADFAIGADYDALSAAVLWPNGRDVIAGRNEFLSALQRRELVAEGALRGCEWAAIPSPEWSTLDVAPRDPARHAPYEQVRIARNELLKAFPPLKEKRASHSEAVEWCRRWIESGNGNGMDKAWPRFRTEPEHTGLSRESMRLAWNEAKGKKAC